MNATNDFFANLWAQAQERFQAIQERIASQNKTTEALSVMITPALHNVAPTWRRILQPMVAVSAATALVLLSTLGLVGISLFFAAGILIYAIMTQVFGIDVALTPTHA